MNDQQPLPRRIAWFAPWTWKRRRLWILIGMLLVLVLVVYPLSMGPAIALHQRGLITRPQPIATFYHPLLRMRYRYRNTPAFQPIRHGIRNYLDIWGKNAARSVEWNHAVWEIEKRNDSPFTRNTIVYANDAFF